MLELAASCRAGSKGDCRRVSRLGRVVASVLICSHSLALSEAVLGLGHREGPAVPVQRHVLRHRGHRGQRGALHGTDQSSAVPAMPGGVMALGFPVRVSPSAPTARFVLV